MDYTQYNQILSYLPTISTTFICDVMGKVLFSSATQPILIQNSQLPLFPSDKHFDVMMCRFALSIQPDPYQYLRTMLTHLRSGGYFVLQDYVLPDNVRDADYINGLLQIIDKNHGQAFAQYAWDGLLLDVGLNVKSHHYQSLPVTIEQWKLTHTKMQHAQILLVQAPVAVMNTLKIRYAGTSFAEFELHEVICVAQKA